MLGALQTLAHGLDRLNRAALFFCKHATIGLLAAIVVVVAAGVWWRYVINDSIAWTEEVAKYLMVWMTFTGAPIALKYGRHVGIEVLPNSFPARLRQATYAIIYLIVLLVMTALTYYGYNLAINAAPQTAANFKMSLLYVYISMPIGTAIMFVVALEFFVEAITGIFDPRIGYVSPSDAAEEIGE